MGALENLQAAIEQQASRIAELTLAVKDLTEKIQPTRETFTLKDLAELPDTGVSLKTLRNWRRCSPQKLPGHGKIDGFARDGQGAWLRETVEAWRRELSKTPFGPGRGRKPQEKTA